jgi:uncharacterized membrane protein YraQ (UPF0718 family)
MALAITFFTALWELTEAMAPYILLGLLFAGILHELLPKDFIQRHLGRDDTASVFKATLFGIPLPLCSCGVVPLAAALKKEGASRGAVLAFLISTPITGIDSILATFGMFGWLFTLYRVASSMVIAIVAGIAANFQSPRSETAQNLSFTRVPPPTSDAPCRCEEGCETEPKKRGFRPVEALRYGFVTLMGDIAKPLLWGLLIGAAITVAIPQNVGELLAGHAWLGYLLVILVAVPMYVCATASLPIAASLVLSGVSLGAAFVFLTAGPATNTVTIGVVKKMLGSRALAIYLGVIVAGSLLFGLGIDALVGSLSLDPRSVVHMPEEPGLLTMISSVTLWGLILFFTLRPLWGEKKCGESCCG